MRLRNIPRAEQVITESAYCINNPTAYKGNWRREIFQNDNPIHIEIGMGKGQFIISLAKAHPEINYIGIERYASVLLRAVEKLEGVRLDLIGDGVDPATDASSFEAAEASDETSAEASVDADTAIEASSVEAADTDNVTSAKSGCVEFANETMCQDLELSNLRLLCFDAAELSSIFEQAEVDRIYLNFSDPWPKARHARRRLTSPEYLNRYKLVLNPAGQIEFKTDNRDLFDFSIESVNTSADWKMTACTYDLHHDPEMNQGNVMTEYEEKFSSMNHPIHKLIAQMTDS